MKIREIEANIKIQDEKGNTLSVINAKGKYQEPESVQEFLQMKMSEEEKVRIISYGLNTIHQAELRSQNNLSTAAKKLVDCGIFSTVKEAFEHLIHLKNAKAA